MREGGGNKKSVPPATRRVKASPCSCAAATARFTCPSNSARPDQPARLARLLAPLRRALFLARHLRARAARFRQPDRDRLLSAGPFLSRAAAAQLAALALVHSALDLALRLLSVLRHDMLSARVA